MLCTVLSLSLSFCCTFHYTHPFASFSRTLQFARPVAAGSRSAWVAKPKPNSRYARLRRIRRSSFQSSCACVCSILYALYCALSLFLLCFTFYSHAYSSLASFSRTLQYFIGDTEVAQSLEDADCCCRIFCSPIHPFKMRVQELSTYPLRGGRLQVLLLPGNLGLFGWTGTRKRQGGLLLLRPGLHGHRCGW
jgi:hypothetical protein